MALRDYKKGKYLLENRPGQLLPIGNAIGGMTLEAAEHQQRRVLFKFWNVVEKAMGEMGSLLISQLQDPSRTAEEQEKTLEYAFIFRTTSSSSFSHSLYILQGAFRTAIER
jgi:exocyst complex component 2